MFRYRRKSRDKRQLLQVPLKSRISSTFNERPPDRNDGVCAVSGVPPSSQRLTELQFAVQNQFQSVGGHSERHLLPSPVDDLDVKHGRFRRRRRRFDPRSSVGKLDGDRRSRHLQSEFDGPEKVVDGHEVSPVRVVVVGFRPERGEQSEGRR